MTTPTTNLKTATEAVQNAMQVFQVNGDDYRQCLWDRLANLEHECCREPAAIDGLICYCSAISTVAEERAITEALMAIIAELAPEAQGELHGLMIERLRWNDLEDCPRYRLWTMAHELTQRTVRSLPLSDAIPSEVKLMFRDPVNGFSDEVLAFSRDEGATQDSWDSWRAMAGEMLSHPGYSHYEYWLIVDRERIDF